MVVGRERVALCDGAGHAGLRIFREERVLQNDAGYRAFAARVRYHLLPGVF